MSRPGLVLTSKLPRLGLCLSAFLLSPVHLCGPKEQTPGAQARGLMACVVCAWQIHTHGEAGV
jgi:hypothetical protein